ncbi:MAG: exopolysaccharide biosynthesis polyprenyl glycosylphosphotransferase [Planctomycetota bacterium]
MMRLLRLIVNTLLINAAFLLAFLIKYLVQIGPQVGRRNFLSYTRSFLFLTAIYICSLAFFGIFKNRFKSSWELFRRVFLGIFIGTLLSITLVYVFRVKWGAFPTSVFILSFFLNLLLVFKTNQLILKSMKRIKKKVVLVGKNNVDDIVIRRADIERRGIDQIEQLIRHKELDEIVICEEIRDDNVLNLLIYLIQRSNIEVVFSPSIYMKMLPDKIEGSNSVASLSTFIGRKRDVEEFFIRGLDVIGSIFILGVSLPVMALIAIGIKVSSPGPIFYRQQRVGKDGEIFTLYKFRTMIKDAERVSGLAPALENDPRVTKVGKWLRRTRLDELPQLLNVLKAEMSLVGPRPENLYRVEIHKALQGLRLAVKPGITGLAQIRSFYDLKPRNKIRYDYVYIQQRSLLLNLYILAKTVPVVLSRKGR